MQIISYKTSKAAVPDSVHNTTWNGVWGLAGIPSVCYQSQAMPGCPAAVSPSGITQYICNS